VNFTPIAPTHLTEIGDRTFGNALFLIAGPCVLTDDDTPERIADRLKEIGDKLGIPVIFKASFDKANRTSVKGFRGPGIAKGLARLASIRDRTGLPLLTDVHESSQCAEAAAVVDVLQIPAYLCRQTDLLLAAAATGKCVNVKKGQFLAPHDMAKVVEKVRDGRPGGAGASSNPCFITERGASFGYNTLISDMRGIPVMQATGYPVVFDGTHSVQQPGGLGDRSGGDRSMVPVLCRAAIAAGADGLFLETYPNPDDSPSDGPNMVPLADMEPLLALCRDLYSLVRAGAHAGVQG
jgi:2-dehydro-3-deoxyphosphooctonate aldolase (KDO 8-P synthase)